MNYITIKNATLHNLKNVSVKIPLHSLVAVVDPSGSGKTTLIYDILYKSSQGEQVPGTISQLPRTVAIGQKVTVPHNVALSLCEYNLQRLDTLIQSLKKNDLLIVDEPCAGLTPEESRGILHKLRKLVTEGKSVIVIEHAKEIIKGADYVIEFGPRSGTYGGEITFQGNIERFKKSLSITAKHVFTKKDENITDYKTSNDKPKTTKKKTITLNKINKNNLIKFTITFPLNSLVCLHGKSGTGKSTILRIVYSALFKGKGAWKVREKKGVVGSIVGKQNVRRTYLVEQTPIADHPTSRPATYLNIWNSIRDIYANLPQAKKLNLTKKDFIVTKEILDGKKTFSRSVLSVKYKDVNIDQLLRLTIDEGIDLFGESPLIKRKLGFLQTVGLGYLTLGQKTDSLSGGEAQRVRLAKVLTKKLGDRCIYILDTPTKGLHLNNIPVLVSVLRTIINKNNTVLIADNKNEIIKNSDYSIMLGK